MINFNGSSFSFTDSPGLPEDVGNPGEIELLVCSPFFVIKLAEAGIHLPNLRWMHSMAAGTPTIFLVMDNRSICLKLFGSLECLGLFLSLA